MYVPIGMYVCACTYSESFRNFGVGTPLSCGYRRECHKMGPSGLTPHSDGGMSTVHMPSQEMQCRGICDLTQVCKFTPPHWSRRQRF